VFRAKTVFVVGAGASFEVGLPVGADLLKQIVTLTNIRYEFGQLKSGDYEIINALKILLNEGNSVTKLNEHLHAGWQLGKSANQAISIDNVIDALEDTKVELVGKIGIVRAILKAEASSSKFKIPERHPHVIEMSNFDDTWYSSLTKLLTENVRKSNIGNLFNNLQIINFNYDRCLEHYLPLSLGDYYGVEPGVIREIMQSLVIHRPYGVVGRLPWQTGDGPSVDFGQCNAQQLAAVVQQVRTFTERIEEGAQLEAMKSAIASADRIVFLGFAFHRQNVELLAQKVQGHTEVVATALGISKSDKSVIEEELAKAFAFDGTMNEGRIVLADSTCDKFFKDYWRTLTAEKSDREPFEFPSHLAFPQLQNPFGQGP
jgi:hypothetical protein